MSKPLPRRSYNVGTILQRTDGVPYVKTAEGWKAEHRLKMEHLEGELEPGWRVYHKDNNLRGIDPKAFNHKDNLVIIKCRTTKWVKLVNSRVLFEPKGVNLKQYSGRK